MWYIAMNIVVPAIVLLEGDNYKGAYGPYSVC